MLLQSRKECVQLTSDQLYRITVATFQDYTTFSCCGKGLCNWDKLFGVVT